MSPLLAAACAGRRLFVADKVGTLMLPQPPPPPPPLSAFAAPGRPDSRRRLSCDYFAQHLLRPGGAAPPLCCSQPRHPPPTAPSRAGKTYPLPLCSSPDRGGTDSLGVAGTMFFIPAGAQVLSSEAYSPASDMYALGVLCLRILAGVMAFADQLALGEELEDVLNAVKRGVLLPEVPETVHPDLAGLIRDCTIFNPRRRPTCSEARSLPALRPLL